MFVVVGVGWMTAAFIRLLSIFFGSFSIKNVGGVFFEGAIGACCCASVLH